MTRRTYPSKWFRVEQRGCTSNAVGCLHLNWPLERCEVRKGVFDTRHVVPKNVLRYCLDAQLFGWTTIHLEAREWVALGQRSKRGSQVRVTGQTEREALQNLCAEMKVKLP